MFLLAFLVFSLGLHPLKRGSPRVEVPIMHVHTRTSFIHQVHQSPPVGEWRVIGCPSWVKCSLTCFVFRRVTDDGACGASGITLVVRLTARVSNRSLTWHPPCPHSTRFMRGGAPQAHGSLVANSNNELSYSIYSIENMRS